MKSLFSFVLLTLMALVACKKNNQPLPNVPPEGVADFATLTPLIEANLTQLGGKAGLLLMRKDGTILYKQYFGGWNDDTYIPIASASKLPSVAVLMTLVDEGLVSLDDTISKFYPTAFAAADRRGITLHQLLSHTSGLSGQSRWINQNDITLQQAVTGIGQGGNLGNTDVPPASTPFAPRGSQFAYGGVSFHVAGGIAEKVTNKPWERLFQQRIADKCQMLHTDYLGLGPTTNYRISGGMGSTMTDYANFLRMLLNDGVFNGTRVLSQEAVNEMFKDQTRGVPLSYTPYENDPLRQSYRYGLGCWLEGARNGQATEFSDQGAFGFSPWIDRSRNVVGVLFVLASLRAVNTQPTPQSAPYTLIRQKVAELLDNP